jgi:hypothetical protein
MFDTWKSFNIIFFPVKIGVQGGIQENTILKDWKSFKIMWLLHLF